MTETLQEKYIRELLDPRSALTPREVAAAEEIKLLRSQLQPDKKTFADAKGSREVKRG